MMLPLKKPRKPAELAQLKEQIIGDIGCTIIRRKMLEISGQQITRGSILERKMISCKAL